MNDIEIMALPNNATMKHNNTTDVHKLEDSKRYKMYDLPRVQIDEGAKCTITKNINLLNNVKWYN